jgi:hypothetical protein
MYFKELKLLLLHPGRTGGTTIEKLLWKRLYPGKELLDWTKEYPEFQYGLSPKRRLFLQHLDLSEALGDLTEDMEVEYTVASIRNSWEKVFSIYTYPGPYEDKSFEFFLKDVEKYSRGEIADMWNAHWLKSQVKYVEAPGRKIDFIIRQENLFNEVEALFKKFNLPALTDNEKFGYQNHNSFKAEKKIQDFYTPELIDFVGRIYEDEIKYFGFKPPVL